MSVLGGRPDLGKSMSDYAFHAEAVGDCKIEATPAAVESPLCAAHWKSCPPSPGPWLGPHSALAGLWRPL